MIPDNAPTGVKTTGVIAARDEIADLNLRIDSLSHTYPGDLSIMLRGPNGYGTDFVWLPGIIIGAGAGDNLVNVVIDDASSNDLLIAPNAAAPYTGSWAPAFNSASWATIGNPDVFPDPIGQLSRYNGTSSAGTWTLLVADSAAADIGSLSGWSLIVTPRAFGCTAYVDPPPVTTITPTPAVPNGQAGWYVTPPTLDRRGDGQHRRIVQETRCALDSGATPATFGALPAGCAFVSPGAPIATDGLHKLYAASIDARANAGTPIAAALDRYHAAGAHLCAARADVHGEPGRRTVLANVTDAASGPVRHGRGAARHHQPRRRSVLISAADVAGNSGDVSCPYTVLSPPDLTITTPTADPNLHGDDPFLGLNGTSATTGRQQSPGATIGAAAAQRAAPRRGRRR